jgi:hypothetical protein
MTTRKSARVSMSLDASVRSESGAVLIITALAIVILLGFAAFAVDLGYVWAQRRSAQNTADVSALAGAIELSLTADAQGSVDAVLAEVDMNIPSTFLSADWVACTDTPPSNFDALTAADLGLLPATSCISFSKSGDEIRVRLPDWEQPTFFAKSIGFDSIDISANAHAGIQFPGVASSPPFVVTSGIEGGELACLRTSPSSTPIPKGWVGNGSGEAATHDPVTGPDDPCDDSVFDTDSQFFGTLQPYVYEDPNGLPADESCRSTGSNAPEYAIAAGIDHPLSFFPPPGYTSGDPEKKDGDGCPSGPPQLFPNTMALKDGLSAQILRSGLLSLKNTTSVVFDKTSFPPRLHLGDHVQSTNTFAGEKMDNQPVWNFIRSDIAAVAGTSSCATVYANRSTPNWDYFDKKEEMIKCVASWKAGDKTVFDESILESSRFTFLPQLAEASLAGLGGKLVHFNAFVPVWIQKLYQEGKSTGAPDERCWSTTTPPGPGNPTGWYWHEAGQDFACGVDAGVDRVSALVLKCGMLPATICDPLDPPGNPDAGSPVETIELTR